MQDIIGASRLDATNRLIRQHSDPDSIVLEIGSNEASFRSFHQSNSWTTVDKYGQPDVAADLDGANVHLPFEDGSIDLVICTEVLEHLRAGSALVNEMSRVLSKQGTSIISVPNICSLKSRVKVTLGLMPNLAASGDCGIPLGGTGTLVDGTWVGGHVVDFNLPRLRAYLERGSLTISKAHKVAIEVPYGKSRDVVTLPAWMYPVTFCDFLLVTARPSDG